MEVFSDGSIGESQATDQSSQVADNSQVSGADQTGASANNWKDLSDDMPIRVPGKDQPIKYGELYKSLQADQTRKYQEVARQREEHQRAVQQWQSQRQAEEARLQALAAELLKQRSGGGQGNKPSWDADLAGLEYIDGKTAVGIVDNIRQEIAVPVVKAFQERDAIIQALYKQQQGLIQAVRQLSGERAQTSFNAKISNWVKELGLPEESVDLAKEIYLAYEGNDLDNEFPDILRKRWEQISNLHRKMDQERVEQTKRQRGVFPGKGGAGRAGKPIGLSGKENAKQTTDALWEALQAEERT